MLHLIPKPPEPAKRKRHPRKVPDPAAMLVCPRCDGREIIVTLIGATMDGRKIRGGTQQILCAGCMLKGERVVLA